MQYGLNNEFDQEEVERVNIITEAYNYIPHYHTLLKCLDDDKSRSTTIPSSIAECNEIIMDLFGFRSA